MAHNNTVRFLSFLKQRGWECHAVYEINARNAEWSKEIKERVLHDSTFVLFDSNPHVQHHFDRSGMIYYVAVYLDSVNEQQRMVFFDNDNTDICTSDIDSLRSPERYMYINTRTLDFIIENYHPPVPNLLRLNTYGNELDALKGGKIILRNTEVIICSMNISQVTEYTKFFENNDYYPVDINTNISIPDKFIKRIEIIFMKHSSIKKYF